MITVTTTRVPERAFIHKRIGKFAKKALGIVGAVGIPGVSVAARTARSFLGGGSRSPAFTNARAAQLARGRAFLPGFRQPVGPGGILGAVGPFRGGVTGFEAAAAGDTCPKGFHLNKSEYHLKSGEFIPEMSRCVKNRRRNNDNGSAAMRAARRLLGRKKSQDTIDKALRAFAPRGRSRAKSAPSKGTTIVQN